MPRKKKVTEETEITTVIDGDKAIEIARTYTPSEYFNKVKSMKEECTEEQLRNVLELAEAQLKKFEKLNQEEAAKITSQYITMFQKEIKAIQAGFTTYVNRIDVGKYMNDISEKCVYCTEIENYPRDIPDEVVDKIADKLNIFDHIYIVFTDYTQKTAKEIKKTIKEKDPIMFGAFDIVPSSYQPIVGPRFYYIADWVDDHCDLTLHQMLSDFENHGIKKSDVLHDAEIPSTKKDLMTNSETFNNEIVDNMSVKLPEENTTKKE